MIRMSLILFFVFFTPFALLGMSLKAPAVAILGVVLALVAILVLGLNSYSFYLGHLNPQPIEDEINHRLQKLWGRNGPERVTVDFYRFRSTRPELRVWAHRARSLAIFMSQGFMEQMTDHDLRTAFRRIADTRMSELMVSNRREAFRLMLERWKGGDRAFRYWFLSFWLYPLERILGISRI